MSIRRATADILTRLKANPTLRRRILGKYWFSRRAPPRAARVGAPTRELISFPKSGRTWLRYALRLLGVEEAIVFHHDGFEYADPTRPPLDFNFRARRRRILGVDNVVYLERDPRDIMVSLYHQITGRHQYFNYHGTLSEFIRDPYFGARNLAEFRRQWNQICASGTALRISYEELHSDFGNVVRAVLSYYELHCPTVDLDELTKKCSFRAMREVEERGDFPDHWLRLQNGHPKTRRGQIGGFRDALCGEDIKFLDSIFFKGEGQPRDRGGLRCLLPTRMR
jgi:Sulfotransferase domain